MESKVSYFITSERALSQLKHWLKSVHSLSIEEFVVLYKVYEATKISGKELRDTLHFEMLWDTSKIDVIIRKIYKRNYCQKYDLRLMSVRCSITIMRHNMKRYMTLLKKLSISTFLNIIS